MTSSPLKTSYGKIELPSELIGKFEATKAETPATPTPTPAAAPAEPQQPQRPRLRARDNNNPYNNNNNNNRNGGYNQQRPAQQRPAQPYNNGENYPAAPERKPVIEREKAYEFDDILTGTGVLKSCRMATASSVPPITTICPHRTIFTYHNHKSNCSA